MKVAKVSRNYGRLAKQLADPTSTLVWRHFMQDSLRRNSSLLILSQAVNSAAGFVFWIICAHLFKSSAIGLATSFISFGALIATFTNLGLPNMVIRFLPRSVERGRLFISALCIVTLFSIFGGIVALTLIGLLVPKLGFVDTSTFFSITLVMLIVFTAISALLDGTLMAFRKGQFILGKALLISLPRLALPFLVVGFDIRGMVGIYVTVFILGISYNLFIILHHLLKKDLLRFDIREIKAHRGYAVSNYLGSMFGVLPSTLVPIIVLNRLGAESAAFFYIPMQISAFLGIISSSTSSALMSESSQVEDKALHKLYFKKSFVHLYQMLLPAILLLSVAAWPILLIYGKQYEVSGLLPLLILAMASVFVGINWLGDTWLNIQKNTKAYFMMNAFNSLAVVLLVYVLAGHGLIFVGIGWLLGQAVSAIVYVTMFERDKLFSSLSPKLSTSL